MDPRNYFTLEKISKAAKNQYRAGADLGAAGFISRSQHGITILPKGAGTIRKDLGQFLCTNCQLSPNASEMLSGKYDPFTNQSMGDPDFGHKKISADTLKKLNVIDEQGNYIPYDPLHPFHMKAKFEKQQKELQDELIKIKEENYKNYPHLSVEEIKQIKKELASEPLQILNETQHIKKEIIETPIQEKSFIDKNKNYLIIGGIAITALILILVVRK